MAKKPQNQAEKPSKDGELGRDKKRHFELKNHRPLEILAGIRRGVSRRFLEFLQPIKKGGVFGVFRVHKKEPGKRIMRSLLCYFWAENEFCDAFTRAHARARGIEFSYTKKMQKLALQGCQNNTMDIPIETLTRRFGKLLTKKGYGFSEFSESIKKALKNNGCK